MMAGRVAIVGVGFTTAQPTTPFLSFKELIFEAAQKAYLDGAVEPAQIGAFVTCAEDLNEGISIFDEYTPDQLGAVQKPMHTLTEDGLYGIADAVMQIQAGVADLVAVEAHSKASNIVAPGWLLDYALDPLWNRPLGFNPQALAGLEMNGFLHGTGITPAQCAHVVAKNRTHALRNPAAAYPLRLNPDDIEGSPYLSYPLRAAETAQAADGCAVIVLASERKARELRSDPVWIKGFGFASDSPTLESRSWALPAYACAAAEMAYRQAGIQNPPDEVDLFEVDDTYAYKELQHLIALKLYAQPGDAGRAVESGETKLGGPIPVNVSGGALGMGAMLEAGGLYRIVELVLQLRGRAGPRQVANARTGLALSWRGVPTASGAVVILGVE